MQTTIYYGFCKREIPNSWHVYTWFSSLTETKNEQSRLHGPKWLQCYQRLIAEQTNMPKTIGFRRVKIKL